jgi:PAS domain-containing protein
MWESDVANAEGDLIARDGSRRPLLFTHWRVELDEGPSLVGIGVDIAERREAEEQVQREKQFADAIIEALPGVFYLFEDGLAAELGKNLLDGSTVEHVGFATA